MDIATIDPSALPSLLLSERAALPDAPAIYFALAGDTVLYIGKARRLVERWKSTVHHRYHQLSAMDGVRLAWLVISDEALLEKIESACIEYFNPALNRSELPPSQTGASKRTFRFSDDLMERIARIAKAESRTITAQVEVFLWDKVRQYEKAEKESGPQVPAPSAVVATTV